MIMDILYFIKKLFSISPVKMSIYVIIRIMFSCLPYIEIKTNQQLIIYIQEGNIYVILIIIIMVLLRFLAEINHSISEYITAGIELSIANELYPELYKCINEEDLVSLDDPKYINDVNRSRKAIDTILIQALDLIIEILGSILNLLFVSISLFRIKYYYTVFFLFMALIQLTYNYGLSMSNVKIVKQLSKMNRIHNYIFRLMHEKANAREIKAYKNYEWLEEKRNRSFEDMSNIRQSHSKTWTNISILCSLGMFILEACIYLFLYYDSNGNKMSVDQIVLIIQSNALFLTSIVDMMSNIKQLSEYGIYCASLKRILLQKNNKVYSDSIIIPKANLVSAKNISFKYKDKTVLKNIDFNLKVDEIVAIIGENGSGKSTLAKILVGLLEPDVGSILVGSDNVSAVFQDFAKFKFTLRENVGLGSIKYLGNDQLILKELFNAQADFVQGLPNLLETELSKEFSDKGVELSLGEWQKVAIARGMIKKGNIIIFDEPSSSLDPLAEVEQFECIKESLTGTGAILISHRIGLARMANRIIFLENGEIIEEGTHDELIKLGGKYTEFFYAQAKWY